jgi:soluble lytic murein transglycosylase-like protein
MAKQFFAIAITILGILCAAAAARAENAPFSAPEREVCARAIAPFERAYDIPGELMQAVALAESGRWDAARQEKHAWPWTVTAGGKGEFLPDKAAAIARVRQLQAQGRRNIDVGCMQVNLLHHPRAFKDLEEAFDPEANAAYAAAFLDDRWTATKSWMVAVSQYHSSTPALARRYWQRVNVLWNEARRRANEALRLAQIEKFERERAARGLPPAAAMPAPPPRLTTIRARPQFGGGPSRQPG